MAGDKFNLRLSSWYKTYGATPGTPQSPLTDLVSALATGVGNISGTHGGATVTEITNSGVLSPGVTSFLNNQVPDVNKPKAYVNWILFDEQFKYYDGGAEQVGDNEEFKTHVRTELPLDKSGYLYVYVSNETPNIDVFFDNLQVTHVRGPILEETHYYPFGLSMSGISSRAAGGIQNRRKFNNGTELESGEFSDGSGLELYATNYRSLDPQLGRFWQIDPLAQALPSFSPYQFANDNPIYFNDPFGLLSDSLHPAVLPTVTVTAKIKHDNTSAWQLGVEWLSGTGPREHHFHGNDPFTKMLKQHEHISDTKSMVSGLIKDGARGKIQGNNNYKLGGLGGVPKYLRDYSTLLTGGLTGNLAVTYMGSYGLKYEVVSIDEQSGTAQVHFFVSNTSTIESATHPPVIGYTEFWSKNIGQPLNNYFSSGAMSKTTQTVEWTETITWK